jgi:Ca2+:H+ antiporter
MQDISLGVALGSATQISMFVVRLKNPRQTKSFATLTLERNHDTFFFFFFFFCGLQVPLCVVVAWTMNIHMDLDFSLLETGSLAFTIIITAFTLQVLSSDIFLITSVDACYIGY